MIKKLRIRNFKCYGPQGGDFNLSKVNFIFGDNSAGKSTMLDFLEYVVIDFMALLGKNNPWTDSYLDGLSYKQCGYRHIDGKLRVWDGVSDIDQDWCVRTRSHEDGSGIRNFLVKKTDGGEVSADDLFSAIPVVQGGSLISHVRASRPSLESRHVFGSMVGFEKAMEMAVDLKLGVDVEARSNDIFRRMGLSYQIEDRETLRDLIFDVSTPISEVGAGIHELLKTTLALANWNGGILEIEEPETHLNEKQMAPLVRVLVEEAIKQPGQLIVECHSELMLLELRNLLAHGKIKPEEVSVNVVEKTVEGSRVTHIPMDEGGNILKPWPGGFFKERVRIADAYYDEEPS